MSFTNQIIGGRLPVPPNNAENPCASCPDKDKRIAFLEEQLRRIHRVGHNDDCLFCGFKDRQVMESNVIEGTAAMSAEEVAEKNEADRLESLKVVFRESSMYRPSS